jgi:hypothetical protein
MPAIRSRNVIDRTQVQTLQLSLSESHRSLYAVLDGASFPNLPAILSEQQTTHVCLLPGELDPELAQAAPYLVQLQAQAPLAELLIAQGWGRHWGILAGSDAPWRAMRMHCRKLLSVWGPDGQPLYFRYYDPRVLRIYLPTCNSDELHTLFGPIAAYYTEGESPDTLVRFACTAGTLGQQTLHLSRPMPPV